MTDPALQALLRPLADGTLSLPDDVLFLRTRVDSTATVPMQGWTLQQSFRPWAAALEHAGHAVHAELDTIGEQRFPLVLVLPPRQRDEARALLARALARVADGGRLLAAAANDDGGRSMLADLARLAGPLSTLSKHHCRVGWTAADATLDGDLLDTWQALDAPRVLPATGLVTRPGLFAWDRIDTGSALLAARLPATLSGRVADLGAGIGVLAVQLLARCPGVTRIDLYEAEARALAPARANVEAALTRYRRASDVALYWHDVTEGLEPRYDAIVCNPPFHVGSRDVPELGRAFIAAAAAALRGSGELWLVANRHLPYEATLAARFADVRTLADADGYKVFRAGAPR